MRLSDGFESRIVDFATPLYASKDIMHDMTHIERVRRVALRMAERTRCDRQMVSLVAYLHGVIWSHERQIRSLLDQHGLSDIDAERLINAAWESQKDHPAETVEGQLLYDAHLLEGDENFIITKTLVTGTARGQSLAATVSYFEEHLGRHRCFFPENQGEYERREWIASEYFSKLKDFL